MNLLALVGMPIGDGRVSLQRHALKSLRLSAFSAGVMLLLNSANRTLCSSSCCAMSRACCQRLENTMAFASGGLAFCRHGLALERRGIP